MSEESKKGAAKEFSEMIERHSGSDKISTNHAHEPVKTSGTSAKNKSAATYGLVAVAVLFVGGYLFFYLPNQQEIKTRANCDKGATESATELLKAKVEMARPVDKKELQQAVDKGLFLRSDYDHAYENCLSRKGLKR